MKGICKSVCVCMFVGVCVLCVCVCVGVCGSITTYFLTIFGSSIRVIWEGERENEDVEYVVICDKLKHSPHLHYRMTVDLDNFVMAL